MVQKLGTEFTRALSVQLNRIKILKIGQIIKLNMLLRSVHKICKIEKAVRYAVMVQVLFIDPNNTLNTSPTVLQLIEPITPQTTYYKIKLCFA